MRQYSFSAGGTVTDCGDGRLEPSLGLPFPGFDPLRTVCLLAPCHIARPLTPPLRYTPSRHAQQP
jgi:hypothetical protein